MRLAELLAGSWLSKRRAQGTARGSSAGTPSASVKSLWFNRGVRASYDAAMTNADNYRHWSAADGLSAAAANRPEIRRTLRNRARYEIANNSYARGISLTLANDCIGTGPRLQMLSDSDQVNRLVEREFMAWSQAVNLAEKLRTMRLARVGDGEAFALLINNPRVDSRVQLDLRLIEAEQVTSPTLSRDSESYDDGIAFDDFGNPTRYDILRYHPGDIYPGLGLEYVSLPAAAVIHYFRPDRPGQNRGIPDITPALPLFAQLRRFTLAVLAAAETAADFAGILYTDAPAGGEADQAEPFESIELEKRALLTMPGGWKMSQMHAEQPATTYKDFKQEILNEIARCISVPYNVAAGNSAGYNYASGRLDFQAYHKALRVEQARIARDILDRVFVTWLTEAVLIEGYLPQPLRVIGADLSHQWFWDGQEHVDPAKEANAQKTRLENHTTTLAHEYARQGRDWETELRQRAKEIQLMQELGLPLENVPNPETPQDTDEYNAQPEEA